MLSWRELLAERSKEAEIRKLMRTKPAGFRLKTTRTTYRWSDGTRHTFKIPEAEQHSTSEKSKVRNGLDSSTENLM
jgi:hypothetical protein